MINEQNRALVHQLHPSKYTNGKPLVRGFDNLMNKLVNVEDTEPSLGVPGRKVSKSFFTHSRLDFEKCRHRKSNVKTAEGMFPQEQQSFN